MGNDLSRNYLEMLSNALGISDSLFARISFDTGAQEGMPDLNE